jgi:hypothetical protein
MASSSDLGLPTLKEWGFVSKIVFREGAINVLPAHS